MPKAKKIAPKNVVNMYTIAGISRRAGIEDYTDGIYNGDASTPYEIAQRRQHDFLLDEVGVREGFTLLDVGCGLGTLLERARERGAIGMGITISEDQGRICKEKGLNVHLLNYRNIPKGLNGMFDGIVANGSLEHFCQPKEAMRGEQDKVYQEMFEIFSDLLDPQSESQRVATTAIHFSNGHLGPRRALRNPLLQLFNDEGFHFSLVHRGYGGYYPVHGQLERCAGGKFDLMKEIDGTEDYRLTSEQWCAKFKTALHENKEFRRELFGHFAKRPLHTLSVVASMLGPEAWPWQFRGENPPTRLYRHTWQKV